MLLKQLFRDPYDAFRRMSCGRLQPAALSERRKTLACHVEVERAKAGLKSFMPKRLKFVERGEAQMKKYLPLGVVVASLWAVPTSAADTPSNVLVDMFTWWNKAYKMAGSYTPEAFGKYFTKDAVMIIDGSVRAAGLDQFSRNFNRIQGSVDSVTIQMPPIESFQEGDRIFTYHRELVHDKGQDGVGYVMGYAVVRDGKIARIDFVNMDEEDAKALYQRETAGQQSTK